MSTSIPADLASDYPHLFHHLPDSHMLLAPNGTVRDRSDLYLAAAMQPREAAVDRYIFDAYPSPPKASMRSTGRTSGCAKPCSPTTCHCCATIWNGPPRKAV